VKVLFIQCSRISEKLLLFWEVIRLRHFVLLVRATCRSEMANFIPQEGHIIRKDSPEGHTSLYIFRK
jgi:hypothetical protein